MQTKNNDKKGIWFDKEKFKHVQNELIKNKKVGSAACVATLTYYFKNHSSLKWIEKNDEIKSFCFYFPAILKTHLYDEKNKCWLENPFDDNNFCNVMFDLLNKDEENLPRNCVLLLEGICFPDIHSNENICQLAKYKFIDGIDLFFTNKWNHIPKPSNQFMDFLIQNISADNIKDYCTKFINPRLEKQFTLEQLSVRNWIFVQCYNYSKDMLLRIQTQNNFIIFYLSLFLDKNFKCLFKCEKNGPDFIESAMNIYENIYKNFMELPHGDEKKAVDNFFRYFSLSFIECVYKYRDNQTAQTKHGVDIYLLRRFYSILKYDEKNLNLILEKLSLKIDAEQDFTVCCKNDFGTSDIIEFHASVKNAQNKFLIKTKNNYERKNIWFYKEKFKSVQDQLTKDSLNPFYSATRVEALTYCLKKYITLQWIETNSDLKNFCFYFPEILKTHLYDEKNKCWLENPFDNKNFCNAMFDLLKKNKKNLSRNCVLLLENFCLPDIHADNKNVYLFQTIAINAMNLFFTNKWNHIPKPSNDFIDFLREQICKYDIEDYCTEFINSKLKSGLVPIELSSRKWILVQENDDAIQTRNNFVIFYLSLFLDKKFKYPFECEKNGLDFIESAMNIYENMYKTFMKLPHKKREDAIYDFFNMFPIRFIKHIIYSYREDKTASIKFKHGIYLFYRFCSILQNDKKQLNLVLENLFRMIDIRQDFVLPYQNAYGTWNFIKLWSSVAKNVAANEISNEKSIFDLKNGQILNYKELLPDELIDKINEYNNKSKSKLQFDIKQETFLIKNGIFHCDENKFLENIESICKIFGLISNKDGEAKKIDDVHLKDFFKLLANNKFNLFKYVCKLESCYAGLAIRGISFLISEFEKFINYHSVKNEANKLFLSNSNDNTFTKKHLFPNPYVCSLYNLMITKFIKAQTGSDELADIVSILLKRFGSIYDLIYKVKNILVEEDYGYKLKGLWNFVLDCVLYVDKGSNKSILSLLIKLVNDNLKKYTEKNDLEQGKISLDLVRSALLLFNVAKAFDYDTNTFYGGQKQKHKNNISDKTFDLLNKILGDENFKSFFELDKTLSIDLQSIKACFQQIKNLNFEVLFYLTDEIFDPNVKQLEQFSPLLEKCVDICKKDGKTTIFDLIQQTEEFTQKKVSKMERINKIKNGAKKIKNYAHEIKEHNLENKNLFLDQIQTENEKESRKANDLLKKLLKQAKKVTGSINVGERGAYLLRSDLLNQYFNSLYEIFCMVYDPTRHINLNLKYKGTYREVISASYNSAIVTKISEYTVSAIMGLNKKNIFEKIDELENIDIEVIGSIISLISPYSNNQVIFFKKENGESIISNIIGELKGLKGNFVDYKKKLGLFNTDQLLNELKENYKGQEILFGNQLIKKAERKQERLINNLCIKSGQFDVDLYKKKKKAMTQLTDLNVYTIKLIASVCILKSTDNDSLFIIRPVNNVCHKLYDFLNMLYVSEDGKNLNSEYKNVCKEVIEQQQEMVVEISKFTIDAIKFLNEKDIFEKVYLTNYKKGEEIDIKIIDDIILLLSNVSQKDIVFFKDEKGKNLTSDIINGLKLLKTNLKINGLRQKFQECKEDYFDYSCLLTDKANICFKDLHDFLLILKEPQTKEQRIYTEVLSGEQNSQMFMLAETLNIILEVIKILNSKDFDVERLKDIDANIIEAIEEIDIKIIDNIILLLSNVSQKDIVFFKDEKGKNITFNIINGLKSFKDKLLQHVNKKNNLQKSNENQVINEIKETEEGNQNQKNVLEITCSEKINSNAKNKSLDSDDNKNNDANNLQNNEIKIKESQKNKNISKENDVVVENKNDLCKANDDEKKVRDADNTKKDNNEKQIEIEKQYVKNEIDFKKVDTFRLIKNEFDEKEKNKKNNSTTAKRKDSFSMSQNEIKFLFDNEDKKNNQMDNNKKNSNEGNSIQKNVNEKKILTEQNNILYENNNNGIKTQEPVLNINSDADNNNLSCGNHSSVSNENFVKQNIKIDGNQNGNIKSFSTNQRTNNGTDEKSSQTARISNLFTNAAGSEDKINEQKIRKDLVNKLDNRVFFLKKWCIFFYQRKKISVSIMIVQIIFLFVGSFYIKALAIVMAVLFVTSLINFLFGRYFSIEEINPKNITGVSNTTEKYEYETNTNDLKPNLNLTDNKREQRDPSDQNF